MENADPATITHALEQAVSELMNRAASALPDIAIAAALLITGIAFAWAVSRSVTAVLRSVGIDRAAERVGLVATVERSGLGTSVSQIAGRVVFWVVALSFVHSAVRTLRLPIASAILDRLIGFMPAIAGAVVTFALGLIAARFAGGFAASASGAGVVASRRIGLGVQGAISLLVTVAALEQVGLPAAALLVPMTALACSAVLACGVAVAFGARPVVTHILAGHFLKQSLPRQSSIEVGGRRGFVERIGPTDTLLRDGESTWSVPNAALLEQVVTR